MATARLNILVVLSDWVVCRHPVYVHIDGSPLDLGVVFREPSGHIRPCEGLTGF